MGVEKKHGGEVVMWHGAGGPVGLLIWNSAARVVWDHNAFRHLFISYCHGWDGKPAAASHTFRRTELLVDGLDQVSVEKSQSGGMPYHPAGPPFISIKWGPPSQGPAKHLPFWGSFCSLFFHHLSLYIYINVYRGDVSRSRLFILIPEYISSYDCTTFFHWNIIAL